MINNIKKWFELAKPNPTINDISVQIGCHFEEVDRSNWSKFVDGKPVFNEQGKIAKPESYSPPNLVEFV